MPLAPCHRLAALLLAGAALSTPTLMAQTAPASSPIGGVKMDIYALPSDPLGDIRVAPGGGRVLTPSILWSPAAGENIHGPAIVMINEGPGSNPGRADQPTRWAAERLAAKGYTVLSLQTHMDRGFPLFPFEETAFEIDAALDSLETRGYEDFILIGNSYGAAAVAHYLATSDDRTLDKEGVRRVRAAVMLDPITELRHYPGIGLDDDYDAVIARAQAAFATGHNGYTASRTVEVGGGPEKGNDTWLGTGFFVGPAESILDYWGPKAAARNAAAYRDNPVPSLAIANAENPILSLDALAAIGAAKPGGLDIVSRPGAVFAPADYDAVVAQAFDWLVRHGMGPRPRVTQRIVDTVTADGTMLPGVMYLPETIDPKKPALILAHGRSGDIIQSSTHWMGWRFAQKGYVVLSPSLRISGAKGIYISNRKEVTEDLTAWMKTYAAMGYDRVVATGHSNGGIWISDYKVLTGDPRIEGMIYFAPTANVATWKEREANREQMRQMKQACAAVKAGKGTALVFGVQSANLVCDSLNRDAVSHPERLAKITVPGLFVIGGNDPLFHRPGTHERLSKAYAGHLDEITYQGGSHGLRESKDRIADDVDAWLTRTFPALQ